MCSVNTILPSWAKLTLVDASDLKSSRHEAGIVQIMVWDINSRSSVIPTRKIADQRRHARLKLAVGDLTIQVRL